ncbi:hypothetical protein [Streptomyces sp. NPDC057382]|uniref:hypothetical protein n=1 Tax=unclassified Streptomyces TaxID=2593676 RepID=UPI00362AC12C
MAETVAVRCPECRREHRYTAPVYPCVCGAPVAPGLDPDGTATPVSQRSWQDDWVTVRCCACGRGAEWPRPEVGCACGVVLRVPLARADGAAGAAAPEQNGVDSGGEEKPEAAPPPEQTPPASPPPASPPPAAAPARPDRTAPGREPVTAPRAVAARPPFQSVTIRTALDAVTATALYLRWLGYRKVRRADQRPPSGIGLAARGVVAQVDPGLHPATPRDVECLWLTAMTESAAGVYFSLAGYGDEARARADALGVPLFLLDPTGTPQPVNRPAEAFAE